MKRKTKLLLNKIIKHRINDIERAITNCKKSNNPMLADHIVKLEREVAELYAVIGEVNVS